ncbi:MAG: ImmA/IrrE family metallo-endopeptidase [Balneola sp.]
MPKSFRKKAEEISLELREELKVGKNDFLDPYMLAANLEVKIISPQNLEIPQRILDILLSSCSDEWSGLGTTINGVSKIYLNTSHVQNRLHSTICHELAHFILEHEPMSVVNYLGIPRTRYNEEQEKEADYLGACLQIPEQALFYLCTFKNYTIEMLAKRFQCSIKMARRRYNETGTKRKMEGYKKKRGWI